MSSGPDRRSAAIAAITPGKAKATVSHRAPRSASLGPMSPEPEPATRTNPARIAPMKTAYPMTTAAVASPSRRGSRGFDVPDWQPPAAHVDAMKQRTSRRPKLPGSGSPRAMISPENGVIGTRSEEGCPRRAAVRRRPRPGCGPGRPRSAGPPSPARRTRPTRDGRRPAGGRTEAFDPPPRRRGARPGQGPSPRDRGRTKVRFCEPWIAERRRLEDPGDVVDGDRPDRVFPPSDQAEDREGMERVAQVVEHVVALAVDHAGLQDRVGHAGRPDDLLGRPFRAVICGRAVRPSAQGSSASRPAGHLPGQPHRRRAAFPGRARSRMSGSRSRD